MPDLTIDVAKAVVDKAIAHDAWAWDDAAAVTDELQVTTAQTLIDAATQASHNNSVADAVIAILHAANVEPQSAATRERYDEYVRKINEASALASTPKTNGNAPVEHASATPPAEPSAPVGFGTPTSSQEQGSPDSSVEADSTSAPASTADISDIFPGYDDLKAADVKKAILASVASGDLSEDEWLRIRDYESLNEERKSILSLEPEFPAPEPEPTPEPALAPGAHQGPDRSGGVSTGFVSDSNSGITHTGGDDVHAFYEGGSPSRAQQESLPLPAEVDIAATPPVLPIDITTTGDQELSRVATQFHSCFARAQWLQSQEEGRERAAEHLEREAERDAYVQAYELHRNEIPEEKRTQPTALEAARKAAERDAEMADPVRHYRSRKVRHGIDARELRALASGYDKAVWRVNEELDRRARLSTTKPS
jgi:hypothetical protein